MKSMDAALFLLLKLLLLLLTLTNVKCKVFFGVREWHVKLCLEVHWVGINREKGGGG